MPNLYIGYYLGKLCLFDSETSSTPCSDQFPVSYGQTATFWFRVKQAISGVKFDSRKPILWLDENNQTIDQPSNITDVTLVDENHSLTFQDLNRTPTEVKHRFTLMMLDSNGNPVSVGPGPSLSKEPPTTTSAAELKPVDPTIIDKGDHGSKVK